MERTLDPYDMDQEDMDYVMQFEDFWAQNDLSRLTDAALPPEFHGIVGNGMVTFGDQNMAAGPVGHFCANYDKAIRKGFSAIKAEAQAKIGGMKGRLYGEDAEREQFYRAVTIVCDAAITLAKRYAAECRRQATDCIDAGPAERSCSQMAEGTRSDHGEPGPHLPRGGPVPVPLPDRPLPGRQPTRSHLRSRGPVPGQLLSSPTSPPEDHARSGRRRSWISSA